MSYYAQHKRFEPMAIVGLLVTLLLHVGAIGGVLVYRRAQANVKPVNRPPSYVTARLIRKGKRKPKVDQKKLPDKIVPQQSTKTVKAVDLTADASAAPNKPKPKKNPRAKIADRQKRALDRVDLMAKAQQEIEQEGDPDGVVGGTASAADGDRYFTRIADMWNRTWGLPAVIPREQAKRLFVLVVIQIDKHGAIKFPIKFDRRSGNPHFDNSIEVAWKQIKQIPTPPPDRMASILANGLALRLTYKGMR